MATPVEMPKLREHRGALPSRGMAQTQGRCRLCRRQPRRDGDGQSHLRSHRTHELGSCSSSSSTRARWSLSLPTCASSARQERRSRTIGPRRQSHQAGQEAGRERQRGDSWAAASRPSVPVASGAEKGWPGSRPPRSNGVPAGDQPTMPAPSIPIPVGRMSPRARRFAAAHGFRPSLAQGSGPGGRILERDVRAQLHAAPTFSGAARSLIDSGYELRGAGSGIGGMIRADDLVPPPVRLSGMRERIARRMGESLATTAQYTLNGSADATGLLALRREIKASP